jgi:NAD(P)-dependent dehydrogenase (short-subunit alcohol dehydrogenase family)
MAKTFEGKTVLVTGGSRGLGAAIARAFAESGADFAISYVASDEKARAVTADVRKHGVQGEAFKADQADPAQISRLVGDVVDRFGKLDILVNNAAVAWLGARVGADNYDAEKMNQQWAINTLGVVATIRAAAKVLSNGGAHHIDQFRFGHTHERTGSLRLRRHESGHQYILKGRRPRSRRSGHHRQRHPGRHHRYRWWVRGLVVPLGSQSLFIRSSMVSECSNNHSCR